MRRQISPAGGPADSPSRSLGQRAPLLWLLLPYITGLGLAHAGWAGPVGIALGVAAVAASGALLVAGRRPRLWGWTLAVALLCAGQAHYQLNRAQLPEWRNLPPREVRLVVRVDRTFQSTFPQRATGLGTVVGTDPHLRDLLGQRVHFGLKLGPGMPPPLRSAEISVRAVLQPLPPEPPAGSFEAYLADAGINFRLSRGAVLQTVRPATPYRQFCARMEARCKAILGVGIATDHPALAGLLRALMLGETSELSGEQRTLFMQSGTMHLFAISGLNIAVIAGGLQAILGLLRLPRWTRVTASLAILWLFVDITGASASAVRAFVMAGFMLVARGLRLPGGPLAALVGSAWCVLLADPLQLFSASFQMSYGIVAALLLLGAPLAEAWQAGWTPFALLPRPAWRWWHTGMDHARRWVMSALGIGLASTLVSLLTGVKFFQLLTPGALLANLALIPAAMLATLSGFAALAAGLAGATWLASLFNHGAALTLLGIEWFVRQTAPWAWTHLPAQFREPVIGSLALAVLFAAMLLGYARRWAPGAGGWWPPFGIVALTLIFGVKFGVGPQSSPLMKSAYELAMERLAKSDPSANKPLTAAQKTRLAEIDRVYQGKSAEREIFLQKQLNEALAAGNAEESDKIRQQLASEKARLQEEKEAEKDRVRQG